MRYEFPGCSFPWEGWAEPDPSTKKACLSAVTPQGGIFSAGIDLLRYSDTPWWHITITVRGLGEPSPGSSRRFTFPDVMTAAEAAKAAEAALKALILRGPLVQWALHR